MSGVSGAGDRHRIFQTVTPATGLVIGTYGSPCYVHLGLEALRRHCGDVPVLVHDDGSPEGEALQAVCRAYGAEFSRNESSRGHMAGDYTVFLHGFRWAARRRLELLVKFSRRWIPLDNWLPRLQAAAFVTQYATYSSIDTAHDLGFRTECTAFHAPSWLRAGIVARMEAALAGGGGGFVELEMHEFAKDVHRNNCFLNRLYEVAYPDRNGMDVAYGWWPLLGRSRCERRPNVLWRNTHAPGDYLAVARRYGLSQYDLDDFTNIKEH